MKISIIVPAYNEERLLGATLRHLRQSTRAFSYRGWETEIIVCDNNSTDGTAEIARAAGATVVFEPFNQIARARNTGAAAARGEWLVFVDADSHPSEELLAAVAERIASGRYLAGGSTIQFDGHYPFANLVVRLWNALSRSCRLMAGSFIFCEARAFRAIGGFNQEHFVAEELDLSQRLKKFARANAGKIVILHRHPVLTSARKVYLYTPFEHARFLLKTAFTAGRIKNRREECFTWYDGRR